MYNISGLTYKQARDNSCWHRNVYAQRYSAAKFSIKRQSTTINNNQWYNNRIDGKVWNQKKHQRDTKTAHAQ